MHERGDGWGRSEYRPALAVVEVGQRARLPGRLEDKGPGKQLLPGAAEPPASALRRHLLRCETEPSIPPAEVRERLAEIVGRVIRPHLLHEQQLCVCALPEEEIAESLLAARPDQQVDVARR